MGLYGFDGQDEEERASVRAQYSLYMVQINKRR